MRRVGGVILAVVLAVFATSALAGDDKAKSEPPKKEAAPPKGQPAPAGSKLAKVEKKMTDDQVRKIMGEPDGEKSYVTGAAFNPWNYGGNSGQNVEWDYKGVGRVIFTVHRYTHRLVVVRVDYDPSEKGD
jgi:outer membrane protein assembly factor BamE (lipoprotein component of BamABCDE complex)